jgi:hypothetical protein
VDTKNKNQTTEKMMPEITDNTINLWEAWTGKVQMVHYYPCCRKPIK